MKRHREALLHRVMAAEQRMRGALFAYDRTNPMFSVNLTMQQLKVLWLVSTHDGIGSQELARQLGVTPATLSGIVDRLVTQGYVTRSEDPDDRRVRRIHLSPTGRTAMEEIMDSGTKARRRLFDRLDDETLEMIVTVLDRITEAARTETIDPPERCRVTG